MSGHNKWSKIKHTKGKADAKRGQLFTKIIRELVVAAKEGGGDDSTNPKLRLAIDKAKAAHMPKDTMERAIKRGTGEIEGASYDRFVYEGYGPEGVAIVVDALSDNKNRTVSELRRIFDKNNGKMGEVGCVSWMFDPKGVILIEKDAISEEDLMDVALEAGAEDITSDDNGFEVTTEPSDFEAVKEAIIAKGITPVSAELTKVPQNTIQITDAKIAEKMMKLIDALEESDDVQEVFANHDISDELMEQIA